MLTDKEKHAKRMLENKRYSAFIPLFMSKPFDEKLKADGLTFTNFLKQAIEKYLKRK